MKPVEFRIPEATDGEPVDSAEDLIEALMPTLSAESMGGFRLVLRADARSLGSEPVDLVAELADELAAPVDLLLAGRDGRVRLFRFDDRGEYEDLGAVPSADDAARGWGLAAGVRFGRAGWFAGYGCGSVGGGWPVGRSVVLEKPRSAELTGVSAEELSTGKGKGGERWATFERAYTSADSSSDPVRYEVSDAGRIRLPDGEVLEPDGWRRFGDDFLHAPSGAVLYGDSGWIGKASNAEAVLEVFGTEPYTLTANGTVLQLAPTVPGTNRRRSASR
ncbi:hypothetical protein NKH77_28830 [Streptomyces sp. M19]